MFCFVGFSCLFCLVVWFFVCLWFFGLVLFCFPLFMKSKDIGFQVSLKFLHIIFQLLNQNINYSYEHLDLHC